VQQRGALPVGLADPHAVAAGNQDLRVAAVAQDAPLDPGQRKRGAAPVGGGRRRRVGQGHQAGQRQGAAQHGHHGRGGGDGHLEQLQVI